MPSWLTAIILELILKLGIPALVTWLKNVLGVGANLQTVQILEDYVNESKSNKKTARERAKRRLRKCHGIDCEVPESPSAPYKIPEETKDGTD